MANASKYPRIDGERYDSVLARLTKLRPKSIMVTGPQRSGTRFTSETMAKDLDYVFVDEKAFQFHDWRRFQALVNSTGNSVFHAPALSYAAHVFGDREDVAVVFMCRPVEEIIASEDRIQWRTAYNGANLRAEEMKYKMFSKLFVQEDPISLKKYKVLVHAQAPRIKNLFLVEYKSLSSSSQWKDRDSRVNFQWDETS